MKKRFLIVAMLVFTGITLPSVVCADDHGDHHKEKKHWKESKNPHGGDYRHNEGYNHDRGNRGYRRGRNDEVYEVRRPREERRYHPHWCPRHEIERRWVYFPRYNMYWDNYREVYVYNTNGRWESYQEPPRVAVNVNLAQEKFVELGLEFDSRSDAFSLNVRHRIVFK